MPNRILRDGILSSELVCSLGWAEEVLYRRLMSVADDYGRFSASPKLIRAACYPLQIDCVSDADITGWLSTCAKAGLILVYAVDGKQYLEIVKFGQQTRSKSKCPTPIDVHCNQLLIIDSKCEQPIANEHLDVVVSEVVSIAAPRASKRCPDDFDVTDEMREWATTNTPNVDIELETETMRDHTFATARKDWPATWRNWMRTASKRSPTKSLARNDMAGAI